MDRMFGTDGVRGVANSELTVDLAMQLGKAGAYVLTRQNAHQPTILVGCDTRISGEMLANAMMAGICSVGANAIHVGVVPTPAIAYLTRTQNADAGVVISASHNPMEFNGIKFFNGEGFKLSDSLEDEIESYIRTNMDGITFPTGPHVGRITRATDAVDKYVHFARETVPVDLSGLKIVVDCAEGASYQTSIRTLNSFGAKVIAIHDHPDGLNINRNCGSTHLEELRKRVVDEKADIGLAFDGDADRLLVVDEKGEVVDGDKLMLISALYMKDRGLLKQNTLVVTVMSNLGLFLSAEKNGLKLEKTKVGDRYVLERMREINASLGGEQSGHIIYLDENTTGDGLLSALHILQALVSGDRTMSELSTVMEVMPQVLINAPVPNDKKERYMEYPEIVKAIEETEELFDGKASVLIRPSGTEPLVRVMIEGEDKELIDRKARELADIIVKAVE